MSSEPDGPVKLHRQRTDVINTDRLADQRHNVGVGFKIAAEIGVRDILAGADMGSPFQTLNRKQNQT